MAIPLHFQPEGETVRAYAEDAVRMMRQHFNHDLSSFKVECLDAIDALLLGWRAQGANVNEIGKTLFMFGSYAGEVLRNLEPGKWFKPEDDASGDFSNYPFLAVKLFDGRVWRPVNVGFNMMLDEPPLGFRASLAALLQGAR